MPVIRSLGIFPATFNPPTVAHLALMEAARAQTDHVAAVLPVRLPHKQYDGASLDQRVAMLEAARGESGFEIRVTEGGLFVEIAHELRQVYGPEPEFWFVCGRDAAQRIVEWDYGHPNAIHKMLDNFGLLVAPRNGHYEPPAELGHRIRALDVPKNVSEISATEVRSRMESGQPWRHLVPADAIGVISRVYGPLLERSKSG